MSELVCPFSARHYLSACREPDSYYCRECGTYYTTQQLAILPLDPEEA